MSEQRDRAVAALAEAIRDHSHVGAPSEVGCGWYGRGHVDRCADAILNHLAHPEAAAAIRAYLGAERDDIGEYRRAAHRGNPDQPIDIETLARALEAADGVQGFGGADMAMRWAERIAAEYTRLRNESQPTEERP